jgi:hypothetical protein
MEDMRRKSEPGKPLFPISGARTAILRRRDLRPEKFGACAVSAILIFFSECD